MKDMKPREIAAGVMAHVSDDIQPETVEALKRMAELVKKGTNTMSHREKDGHEETIDEIKRLVLTILDDCGDLCDLVAKLHPAGYKSMPFHGRTQKHRVDFAKARRKEGYSIRQIAGLMNYKSHSSVQKLLEMK